MDKRHQELSLIATLVAVIALLFASGNVLAADGPPAGADVVTNFGLACGSNGEATVSFDYVFSEDTYVSYGIVDPLHTGRFVDSAFYQIGAGAGSDGRVFNANGVDTLYAEISYGSNGTVIDTQQVSGCAATDNTGNGAAGNGSTGNSSGDTGGNGSGDTGNGGNESTGNGSGNGSAGNGSGDTGNGGNESAGNGSGDTGNSSAGNGSAGNGGNGSSGNGSGDSGGNGSAGNGSGGNESAGNGSGDTGNGGNESTGNGSGNGSAGNGSGDTGNSSAGNGSDNSGNGTAGNGSTGNSSAGNGTVDTGNGANSGGAVVEPVVTPAATNATGSLPVTGVGPAQNDSGGFGMLSILMLVAIVVAAKGRQLRR